MEKILIEMKQLNKQYHIGDASITALDNVSLTVKEGEFIAIIGPSGSGKSTLMNMIGCLDKPDEGQYTLAGEQVAKMNDNQLAAIRNKRIGFIFQSFHLLPKLTAVENVALPLLYNGINSRQRRKNAEECLEKVGLLNRASHLPAQLSGGQQQRVAIARSLVCRPSILLADEPTGALDSKTSADILQMLKDLQKQGHTLVMITHDMEVAKQAKKIIQMKDGKLYDQRSELLWG
ncbi:ABC transporter ATP-binding protein [Virgibacillus halophilus]|uniref:ABC transporter ATP-binding protein n=1 Tax=Tigheibacillus halophilus TaxID=361280 RepID=A0ABU5C429_9BACI|nr:ABC transporter ATP-binding protein [Virgibacillus halophilus]